MKKRKLILLISLFSFGTLNGCSLGSSSSSCDDMFCEEPISSTNTNKIVLEEYKEENYTFDDSVSNEQGSVSYEIFVRSFYDTDFDGIGDFNGVKEKLPYLKELGIKTVWLMPIMPSISYHGYDVVDYYSVHSDYGTMQDFENLLKEASNNNIDIMIDIVFNHSSIENEWFKQSYEDYINNNEQEGSKKDWYCWSEKSLNGYRPYKNNSYYEGRFDSSMPDFNTKNPEVREEMVKILKYWVDKGVKGFRFDAVKYFDYEVTHYNVEFLSYLANTIKEYNKDIYFVGECWDSIEVITNYYKSSFDSFFKFNNSLEGYGEDAIVGQVKGLRKSNSFGNLIEKQEKNMKANNPNGYSSYFLTNHDMDRASNSLIANSARMAASLTYLLPGTPYMYYGEEILLKGKRITSPDDASDARRRLPMIWDGTNSDGQCGFPETNRMDLATNEQVSDGVKQAMSQNYSVWNHYKKVINIRNKYPFIKKSIFSNETEKLNTEYEHVLAYKLSLGDEYIVVIHNFEADNVEVDVSSLGTEMLDEVSCSRLTPVLENGKLKIGRMSTVILK